MKSAFVKIVVGLVVILLIIFVFSFINSDSKESNEHGESSVFEEQGFFAWGANNYGQLGNGRDTPLGSTHVEEVLAPQEFKGVVAGNNHGVLLTVLGEVYTWGLNENGQLGRETEKHFDYRSEIVVGLSEVKQVSAGMLHTLVLKNDGTVWAFGSNFSGQLGDKTNSDSFYPRKVVGLPKISRIGTGYRMSYAIAEDGTLWGWGTSCGKEEREEMEEDLAESQEDTPQGYADPYGHDFDARDDEMDCIFEEFTGIQSKEPIKIFGIENAIDVSGGYGHTVVLKNDGSVWTFGCNLFGQLGRGTSGNDALYLEPQKVKGLPKIKSTSAGFRHTLALDENGTVWSWGHNRRLQLGSDTQPFDATPKPIEGLASIVSISAGHDYSVAITQEEKVLAWGNSQGENIFSLKGLEGETNSKNAIEVLGIANVKNISAGHQNAIAF